MDKGLVYAPKLKYCSDILVSGKSARLTVASMRRDTNVYVEAGGRLTAPTLVSAKQLTIKSGSVVAPALKDVYSVRVVELAQGDIRSMKLIGKIKNSCNELGEMQHIYALMPKLTCVGNPNGSLLAQSKWNLVARADGGYDAGCRHFKDSDQAIEHWGSVLECTEEYPFGERRDDDDEREARAFLFILMICMWEIELDPHLAAFV